ncbi:phosphatidylinositol alpha-mannosyltransferase [Motilibacter rhizosphaerae]|uniref:Phosphatidylinositol alpha-mannosyltransferase n=1 Tax=Motilibacter rhizosphaerae TaxID=598652 RepID=A0A4Q7NQW7_9ACTN|nr:glycosyltransferase family 4 protein [Motilibacter rhizosphaerae]RZS89446.1 phosphatidylinositol alpha-mannosyltransferase [Motilibacter rhizosphaerae]
MRVGLVCPYAWDVPGGVQFHVRDLAERLLELGHEVSVLAPADDELPLPDYVVPAGRAVPVPYNGSVARLVFGPLSAARVRRWLATGEFDVVHIHEPATPSLSLLTCWAADGPLVGTFHTASLRSRAYSAFYPVLYPALEKLSARIAVSEDARRTVVEHIGGDAVVIPNGVVVDAFARAAPREEWRGADGTVAFLGRLDEPRKGLPTLLAAWPAVLAELPHARLLVGGRGDLDAASALLPAGTQGSVRFLGQLDDADKAAMLRTADVYAAPNTGGESFGIVLAEAMAAGAAVVASDLPAFTRVLEGGRAGVLVPVEDPASLAAALVAVLRDGELRRSVQSEAAVAVRRYDWSVVAADVLAVYETVAQGAEHVRAVEEDGPGRLGRLWARRS